MTIRPLTLFGILVSMVTGMALGVYGYQAISKHDKDTELARAFEEVLTHVQSSYVDEVEQKTLLNSALRGMLHELDPHSNYLEPDDYDDLQAETTGRFGGIGIELGLVDGYFTVITPLDGTPASDAGMRTGDRLIELDATPLKGKSLMDVVKLLRGEPGSPVQVTLARPAESEPLQLDMNRAVIEVASVSSRVLEPGYGYVRISQFQITTSEDFVDAINELKAATDGNLLGLVLDLRNNPGGVLQASVGVADALLEDGLIVYTEGRLPSSHLRYRASGKDLLAGAPVVVLINQGSASAAEIVAGALQDHHRARLLGSRSYGKGSVQSVMPLTDAGAIKLTTAYYYTPSGRSIHHKGIEPDVALDNDEPSENETTLARAVELLKQDRATQLAAETRRAQSARL